MPGPLGYWSDDHDWSRSRVMTTAQVILVSATSALVAVSVMLLVATIARRRDRD